MKVEHFGTGEKVAPKPQHLVDDPSDGGTTAKKSAEIDQPIAELELSGEIIMDGTQALCLTVNRRNCPDAAGTVQDGEFVLFSHLRRIFQLVMARVALEQSLERDHS